MDSIELISKNKKRVKKFFLRHASINRQNAFIDLRMTPLTQTEVRMIRFGQQLLWMKPRVNC